MHINTVPARTGFHWLELGFHAVSRQPLAWLLLSFPWIACYALASFVPWIGPALSMALQPLLWLLPMVAAAQVIAGHSLKPAALLAALRGDRFPALLALCALYLIVAVCPLMLATLIDGGSWAGVVLGLKPMNSELQALWQKDPRMQLLVVFQIFALPLMIWFAPGLVHWHGVGTPRALRLGMAACLRNWRALLVLSLSCIGIFIGICTVLVLGVVLLGPHNLTEIAQSAYAPFAKALMFALMWILTLPMIAAAGFSFHDCFPAPQTPATTPVGPGLSAA